MTDWQDEFQDHEYPDAQDCDDEAADQRRCPQCGAWIYADAEQCVGCGEWLLPRTRPAAGWRWLALLLAVVLIGLLILQAVL